MTNRGTGSDKRALRAKYNSIRSAIPPHDRARFDATIQAALLTVLPGPHPQRPFIGLYRAIRGEVDIFPVAHPLIALGWRVAVPTVQPGDPTPRFVEVDKHTNWKRGPYGIEEPALSGGAEPLPACACSAVVVPGLAFTKGGDRLGYGGGYYDGWLATADVSLRRVAVAYQLQIAERLPADAWDQTVDVVVTEHTIYHCYRADSPTLGLEVQGP